MPKYFTYSIKIVFAVAILSILIVSGCNKLSNDNTDDDNDGIENSIDNCVEIYNPDQIDTDGDGIGDECDSDNYDGPLGDPDEDGVYNKDDNCPDVYNPDQADEDNDDIGNLCDPDWIDPNGDLDGDGILNGVDSCPNDYNIGDSDGDGIDDACDSNLQDGPLGDLDGDGFPNNADSCPNDYNLGTDYDNDGIDDACDPPPPEYALTFGLYDDFDGMGCEQTYDGSQMAVAGSLSGQLWRHLASEDVSVVDLTSILNDSVSYGANPSGNIVKMVNDNDGDIRLEVVNPEKINFADFQSFSADVMISSKSTNIDCKIALDFHTSIPEQPPGASWLCQIKLMRDSNWDNGNIYIAGQCMNKNTDYNKGIFIQEAMMDTWYNLRMDILKLDDTLLEVKFYVNDELKVSEIPPDGEILLDPSRLLFGPKRSFEFPKPWSICFIDNIKAVYSNRIQ